MHFASLRIGGGCPLGVVSLFCDLYRCSFFDPFEEVRYSIPLAFISDAGDLVHGGVLGLRGLGKRWFLRVFC